MGALEVEALRSATKGDPEAATALFETTLIENHRLKVCMCVHGARV